jgi:hypothetical protein
LVEGTSKEKNWIMAVFGNFADFPFPELLTLVGYRTGKILIRNTIADKQYEWHLHSATICGVIVNSKPLDDVLQVRGCMLDLIDDSSSAFEFHRHSYEELLHYFNLPTEHLVLSTAAAMDELSAYRNFFPHEQTYFQSNGQMDIWLDEQLSSFWERSSSYFKKGCNARDLAENLHLNLEQVQLNFYKLRSVGKIAPVRLYEGQALSERPLATLEANIEATASVNPYMPELFSQVPSGSALPSKAKGLVRRMMKALSISKFVKG